MSHEDRVEKYVQSLRERGAARPAARGPKPAARRRVVPKNERPIFDPQTLAALGRLDLIASTVVDGFLSGKHRSTHKGGCTDFAEFRPYAKGDDLRQLDWRHYAKSDRYYVKRYDDETNLQAIVVADASGSMAFGRSTVTKWHYTQMVSACLAHLLLRQRDSVGLAVVAAEATGYIRPLPRASHLARLLDTLSATYPHGEPSLPDRLLRISTRLKRRGMVILLSDCFCDVDALAHVLEQFRLRGQDVLVFQVLAPEELTFPFRREALFQDLEIARRMRVEPNTIRKQYLEEFQKFMDKLHTALTDIGADLMTVTTDQDVGTALAYHIRRRAAIKAPHRARAGA